MRVNGFKNVSMVRILLVISGFCQSEMALQLRHKRRWTSQINGIKNNFRERDVHHLRGILNNQTDHLMRKRRTIVHIACFVTISLALARDASGQGFVNLDFEDANLPISPAPATPTQVLFADAFPGWTGYIGTSQATLSFDNGVSVGGALITLITGNTGNFSNNVVGGFYTAVLSSGSNPQNLSQIIPAALAQTGTVPVGARSLLFNLGSGSRLEGLSVTFNGQNLVLVPLLADSNYETYGADISAFAGTSGELRFTESPTSLFFNNAFLDDIQFSAQVVPEPNLLSLSGLCIFFLLWHRRRALINLPPRF